MMNLYGGNQESQQTGEDDGGFDLMGDMGGDGFDAFESAPTPAKKSLTVTIFEDSNLEVVFNCTKESENETKIISLFNNRTQSEISNLTYQIAVLKYMKLDMKQLSSNSVGPGSTG